MRRSSSTAAATAASPAAAAAAPAVDPVDTSQASLASAPVRLLSPGSGGSCCGGAITGDVGADVDAERHPPRRRGRWGLSGGDSRALPATNALLRGARSAAAGAGHGIDAGRGELAASCTMAVLPSAAAPDADTLLAPLPTGAAAAAAAAVAPLAAGPTSSAAAPGGPAALAAAAVKAFGLPRPPPTPGLAVALRSTALAGLPPLVDEGTRGGSGGSGVG